VTRRRIRRGRLAADPLFYVVTASTGGSRDRLGGTVYVLYIAVNEFETAILTGPDGAEGATYLKELQQSNPTSEYSLRWSNSTPTAAATVASGILTGKADPSAKK